MAGGHYLQIKPPDCQAGHIDNLEKNRADFSSRLQAFLFRLMLKQNWPTAKRDSRNGDVLCPVDPQTAGP